MRNRLDQELVNRSLISTRSQAESEIKLGSVKVNKKIIKKPGFLVSAEDQIIILNKNPYVNRAALKLKSANNKFKINFNNKTVLDVGSSTGGFTDYALQNGAKKVIAVDVGTDQLHPSLRNNQKIELYEKTDIREFIKDNSELKVNIILIDVSFISLKEILPSIRKLAKKSVFIVAMAKPQFESGEILKHKGVIKNEKARREVLKQLEGWIKNLYTVIDKADSEVEGSKGNLERFYLLKAS